MREIIKNDSIIAILRNLQTELVIPYVQSIVDGGINVLEVAMNTPDAARQIKTIKDHFGSKVIVGAGTAITVDRIESAVNAGAEFFLTPSVEEELLEYFKEGNLKLLPGVMTPSDVHLCLKYDFDILKLFPAGNLPMSYIKSLKGPFNKTDYVAVGGVTLDNLSDFFNSGFVGAGIASNLVPQEYISSKHWDKATEHIKKFTALCKK